MCALLAAGLLALCPAVDAGLHVLAISNAHYVDGDGRRDLPGAYASARSVTALFTERYRPRTITHLRSSSDRLVSRGDVLAAIEALRPDLAADPDPVLVVYYMGHGFGEGIAWNYFLLPGDRAFPERLDSLDLESLAEQWLWIGGLVDALGDLGTDYFLLLDACYEGREVDFENAVLSPTASGNLRDVAAVLRFMNEFRQPDPVVFSTAPGGTVRTVPHPDGGIVVNIGPIARRLLLAAPPDEEVAFGRLVQRVLAPDLDARTAPAVSRSELDVGAIPHAGPGDPVVRERFGTASSLAAGRSPGPGALDTGGSVDSRTATSIKPRNP